MVVIVAAVPVHNVLVPKSNLNGPHGLLDAKKNYKSG